MNHILITFCLHGLRIFMQLVVLSFYKKAFRIIFQRRNSESSPLFNKRFILKFLDSVNLENTLFFSKSIINVLPSLNNDWFLLLSEQQNHEVSRTSLGNLHKPSDKTNIYCKNYIIASAINA